MWSDFLNPQTIKEGMEELMKQLQQYNRSLETTNKRLIYPDVKAGFLRNQLQEKAPQQPQSLKEIIHELRQKFIPGTLQWNSPKYFGYYPCNVESTNIIADAFGTIFHSPGFNYSINPSQTQLENVIMDWTVQILGLPRKFLMKEAGGGIINSSTSDSIFAVVNAAKKNKIKQLNLQLTNPTILKFAGYYTDFCHACAEKALILKDIAYIRKIPSFYDPQMKNFTVNIKEMKRIIQEDIKQGIIPFYYSMTYGSTLSCANDLVQELIDFCKKHQIWMHLDAAYLGPVWICQQMRPQSKLLNQMNSISLNYSKALFQGTGGSILFVSSKQQLTQANGNGKIQFSFFTNEFTGVQDIVDYKDWTINGNRRNNALKFYFMYKFYGLKKLRQNVKKICSLAEYTADLVNHSQKVTLFCPPIFGLVCLQVNDQSGKPSNELTKLIGHKVKNIPQGYTTSTGLNGYQVIRIAIGNDTTTKKDLDQFFAALLRIIEDHESKQTN